MNRRSITKHRKLYLILFCFFILSFSIVCNGDGDDDSPDIGPSPSVQSIDPNAEPLVDGSKTEEGESNISSTDNVEILATEPSSTEGTTSEVRSEIEQ